MEFEPHDRFLRDLNPDLHFKATTNGYRLTSAVFRDRRVGDGRHECSVDAERIAGDNAGTARIARGHGEWGVGRVSLDDVRTIGEGDVAQDPVDGNPAHCALSIRGAKARWEWACSVASPEPRGEWHG